MPHSEISKKDYPKTLLIDSNEKRLKKLVNFIAKQEYLKNHVSNMKASKQLIIRSFPDLMLIGINLQSITAYGFYSKLRRNTRNLDISIYWQEFLINLRKNKYRNLT